MVKIYFDSGFPWYYQGNKFQLWHISLILKYLPCKSDDSVQWLCASFMKSVECLKTSSSTRIKDFMPYSKVIRIIMILQRFKIQNLLHPNLYSMTLKKIVCWKLLPPFKSAKISGVLQQYMLKVKLSPIQFSIQMEFWTCKSYCVNLGNLLNTAPVAWKRFGIYINLCPIYDLHRITSMTWSKS